MRNLEDPTDTFYCKKLLQGLKNQSYTESPLLPADKALLHLIIDHLPLKCSSRFDIIMMKADHLCMYYGCLRVGEALVAGSCQDHTLKLRNVRQINKNRHLTSYHLKGDHSNTMILVHVG